MNKIFTLCSALAIASTFALTTANAQESNAQEAKLEAYHTYNQTYYQDNQIIEKYLGDLIAVKGKVLKIEKGPENKVIFKIKLDGLDKTLWVATIMNVLENAIKIGDNARIMGFLDETEKEPQYVAKLSQDREYLLGFCFHIDNSGLPIYFNRFMSRCVQWENGEPFKEQVKIVDKPSSQPKAAEQSQTSDPQYKN